jgi:hypothetical protein
MPQSKTEYWRIVFKNGIFVVVPGRLGMSGKLYTDKLTATIACAKLNGNG